MRLNRKPVEIQRKLHGKHFVCTCSTFVCYKFVDQIYWNTFSLLLFITISIICYDVFLFNIIETTRNMVSRWKFKPIIYTFVRTAAINTTDCFLSKRSLFVEIFIDFYTKSTNSKMTLDLFNSVFDSAF